MNQKPLPLEEAQALLLHAVTPITATQALPLLDCLGHILAEDICAPLDIPPFHRSPVDGYACIGTDVSQASPEQPVVLDVIGQVNAGQWSDVTVTSGQAFRIMTGAPIPAGCNCCVRQEHTDYGDKQVTVFQPHQPWTDFCYRGEDMEAGTLVLKQGTKLSYAEAGILASLGYDRVSVYRKPRIALFTTGDELTAPGQPLPAGKIYDSNQTLLAARLRELHLPPSVVQTVADQPEAMAEALLATEADLYLTTGGVSVGQKDILHDTLPLIQANTLFWKVAIKPGSPTLCSTFQGRPLVSLSGNPFGALIHFELLVRPLLAKLCQDGSLVPPTTTATLADGFPKASKVRRLIRGRLEGGTVTLPQGGHSSGVLSSLQGCNCLVDIPADSPPLHQGDTVSVVLL